MKLFNFHLPLRPWASKGRVLLASGPALLKRLMIACNGVKGESLPRSHPSRGITGDQRAHDLSGRNFSHQTLRALPGYPWLPCPICRGTEGCDHTVPERARTAHPGLIGTF